MEFEDSPPEPSSVVELEFRLSHERYPFVRISDAEECAFELVRFLPRGEGTFVEYFAVSGADPAAVAERAAAADEVDQRLVAHEDSHALFEWEVTDGCPVVDLAREAAIPVSVESEDGVGHVEAEVVSPPDPSTVVESFTDDHPDAVLVEKTRKDAGVPLFTRRELAQTVEERLTERQREVLGTAYEGGYYDRPREATGEELAERLDISVATFSQHLRVAERTLLDILAEEDLF